MSDLSGYVYPRSAGRSLFHGVLDNVVVVKQERPKTNNTATIDEMQVAIVDPEIAFSSSISESLSYLS